MVFPAIIESILMWPQDPAFSLDSTFVPVRSLDDLFAALARSGFRRSFQLKAREIKYLQDKGLPVVLSHAQDFISKRLAPAFIPNDGKQTPFRGHPVFIAQHATATCCRGCLEKWHRIEQGSELSPQQQAYIITVLERWLQQRQT